MATVSSVGIGSGLDVSSIISKLVDLEKQPLVGLQAKQAGIQAQVSTYAQIKSLTSALSDAASKLTLDSGWNALAVKSGSDAVAVAVTGLAQAGSFDIGVSQLARAQTSVSDVFAAGAALGADGTLQLTPQGGEAIDVAYTSTDTLASLAAKINDAASGVTATVMRDASGERLMLRSRDTGADAAFTVSGLALTESQSAQNARITVNGVATESTTNDFGEVLPGLKITASQVTAADVHVSVAADTETTKKNLQTFVDAYNALNALLADSTKYDSDTKTAGILQGDSATVGLQNALRMLTMGAAGNATGGLKRLADVGIQMKSGGALEITDMTRLDKALAETPDAIQSLFAAKASPDGSGGGIAVNFKQYTSQLLAFEGTLNSKSDALAKRIQTNQDDQSKVNERASVLEARLTRQYSMLDTQMATLQSLSAYMEQQITNWNKSKS
ncbi:MAG: flagellar filament capping protein FliD [Comamonadaceae bacterium]|nr:flagellar filament capping protein FliD [Burkholderiales bacterium]MEB2348529.1 flagellar filament capping protein FliD [Comamonadaceae bacterium]